MAEAKQVKATTGQSPRVTSGDLARLAQPAKMEYRTTGIKTSNPRMSKNEARKPSR
jgi:hypothetical protein